MKLSTFLAGLDIEGFGETMAQKLIDAGFNSLEKLLISTEDQIASVHGFAQIMAKIVVEGLNENSQEMKNLVNNKIIEIEIADEGILNGKSFCFTGELHSMNRNDAQSLVKKNGGMIKSSDTKDLNYHGTNDKDSGSSKNQKAVKFGIPIIDEETFLQMINKNE